MKKEDLLHAIGQTKGSYVMEAQALRSDQGTTRRSGKTVIWKGLLAAAMISMLVVTAYAKDFLNIRTLTSGTVRYTSASYENMGKAMNAAGFQMDVRETLAEGYAFEKVCVQDTVARDKQWKAVLTYRDIDVTYLSPAGNRLQLHAYQKQEEIPVSDHDAALVRVMGDIPVSYYLDHYKNVPPDYKLTEADALWEQKPGNFISYGTDKVENIDVSFLCWEKDGICYSIMDMGAEESPDALFAMAKVLLGE